MSTAWTHASIGAALAKKYDAPRYAYFSEVFHSVGGGRRADGIAIAMWRSLGLYIHGFEIKTSRTDWLRELKNPAKADDAFRYCDYWWLAIREKEIARTDEVPPDWGILAPNGSGLHVLRAAKRLKPDAIARDFLCSILRLAHEKEISPPRLRQEFERGCTSGEESNRYRIESLESEVASLRSSIKTFHDQSGVHIDRWNSGNIGNAVRAVMDGAHLREKENLNRLKERAEEIVKRIAEALEAKP